MMTRMGTRGKKTLAGPTTHRVIHGDARDLWRIEDESVHLVVTSPPYAFLKQYTEGVEGQLGDILDYEEFLDELDKVWRECARVLVPGGRVACVVGDVCISRRRGGRHYVLPLSADIQTRSRRLGLDNLTPIRWYKVSNIKTEASRSSVFLGKPNLPNGIIKNDLEHILLLRKPGGYRSPSEDMNARSRIETDDYRAWFKPVWTDVTGQQRKGHPAPYPLEVPRRLIRMFSFVGDVVLDPFCGTATTAMAAIESGRSSISYEIDESYIEIAKERLATTNVPIQYESAMPNDRPTVDRLEQARSRLAVALERAQTENELLSVVDDVRRLLDETSVKRRRPTAG
jgi:DNA modification methylase